MSATTPPSSSSSPTADTLRAEVARDYADKSAHVGCGRAAPSHAPGAYGSADFAAATADAVDASFGCGNPLAFSGVQTGDTVVDLGSGAGLDLLIAAKRTGPSGHVIGIDMTDAMIARARANLAKVGVSHAEVRKGIIEDLPVDTASVDWVISNCVVNLSPEKKRVFSEVARVLRPGGQMLISDIVIEGAPSWVRAIVKRVNRSVAGAIGEAEYVAGLRAAGLADVEVRGRYVYDKASIEGMIASEIEDALVRGRLPEFARGPIGAIGRRLGSAIAKQMAGKVTSVQVYARKPGGTRVH